MPLVAAGQYNITTTVQDSSLGYGIASVTSLIAFGNRKFLLLTCA